MKKKSLIGAIGAAVILSTVGLALPAQAATMCWGDELGWHCKTYADSATGLGRVKAMEHPTFTGVLKAGQTLTANSGDWDGSTVREFQWYRDGSGISGAWYKTYKLTSADTGHSITLRVTASGPNLKDGVETTLASPLVADTNTESYTARPGITGEAPVLKGSSAVGSTLSVVNLGTWSPGNMTLETEWQVDGKATGVIGPNYTIQLPDLGKDITLKLTGKWPGEKSVVKSSAPVTVTKGTIKPGPYSTPEVSGDTTVGSTLTVDPGWWDSQESPSTFAYQWLRDGAPISGATKSTYKLVTADKGHVVTVKVTGSAPDYFSSSVVVDYPYTVT